MTGIGYRSRVTNTPSDENETYNSYSVDDEDQPQDTGDSLTDDRGLEEPLDEGYSPPEKPSAAQGWGNTPLEEELGETLDQRIEQEEPEPDPYEEAATADEVLDDGAGASAEEAAVHVVDDEDQPG